MSTWLGIGMVIGSSAARSAISGVPSQLEEQLAELRKEREDADTEERGMLGRQIQALEGQLRSLGGISEANDVDKHNMEVLERWKDRLEAAGGQFATGAEPRRPDYVQWLVDPHRSTCPCDA